MLVAAIIVKALKLREKNLLPQFSTKLNKFFITFWAYLDTKSTNIYTNIFFSPKNWENAIYFPETVGIKFIKEKFDSS